MWSAVLRRAAGDRVVLAAAFVTILLAVTLLSTGPIYASAVSSNGLQRSLEDAPTTEGNVEIARPPVNDVTTPMVEVRGLRRDFRTGEETVHALRDVDLTVERGSLVAVHGPSGSGKTTLLNAIGGLDRPTAGHVMVDGTDVTQARDAELLGLRRGRIGFIFQTFGLIPILTAAENVEIPLRLSEVEPARRTERVRVLLELVGLGERAEHRPHELSGGEQQRVAIARALANSPALLIADEPTGQLDSRTGRTIMTLIRALVDSKGVTALVATHDPALIDVADRIVELRDGRIVDADVDPSEVPGVSDVVAQPPPSGRRTTRAPEDDDQEAGGGLDGGDLIRAPKRRPPRQ